MTYVNEEEIDLRVVLSTTVALVTLPMSMKNYRLETVVVLSTIGIEAEITQGNLTIIPLLFHRQWILIVRKDEWMDISPQVQRRDASLLDR